VLAFCVGALSVLGLNDLSLPVGATGTDTSGREESAVRSLILIPYAALAIAVFFLSLVLSIKRIVRNRPRHADFHIERDGRRRSHER